MQSIVRATLVGFLGSRYTQRNPMAKDGPEGLGKMAAPHAKSIVKR